MELAKIRKFQLLVATLQVNSARASHFLDAEFLQVPSLSMGH